MIFMEDKFNKILEENPELAEAAERIAFRVMPSVIATLIMSGKIDKTRINELEYVLPIVLDNLDVIDEMQRSFRIDNQFMESAREAAKFHRIPVMVVLVATTIEHLLNMFYRDTLEDQFNMSAEEVTDVIRSNIHTKLGWLLKTVSDKGISGDLQKRVKKIMDLRNGFVHYKSIGTSMNEPDQIQRLINEANEIGEEIILSTPEALERELSAISAELFPEREMAKQVT